MRLAVTARVNGLLDATMSRDKCRDLSFERRDGRRILLGLSRMLR